MPIDQIELSFNLPSSLNSAAGTESKQPVNPSWMEALPAAIPGALEVVRGKSPRIANTPKHLKFSNARRRQE
jgi:hypothetical protein